MKKIIVSMFGILGGSLLFGQSVLNPSAVNVASGGALYLNSDVKLGGINAEMLRGIAFDSNFRRSLANDEVAKIAGSPYIYGTFIKAEILGTNMVYEIRYNALEDKIEVKQGKDVVALKKEKDFGVVSLKDYNVKIKLKDYVEDKKPITGYLFEVYSNPVSKIALLEKKSVIYKQGHEASSAYDIEKPARFVNEKPTYFVEINGDKIMEIPSKKNDFIKLFPDKKQQLEEYFKKNNYDNGDVIKISNLLKTL